MRSAPENESQTLTTRLTSGILATVLIVSLIAVAAMYQVVTYTTHKGLEQKADGILVFLVGALELPLWAINENEIEITANAVYQDESVARLIVRDDTGKVIFSKKKDAHGALTHRSSKIFHKQGNREINIGEIDVSLAQSKYQNLDKQLLTYSVLIILLILASIVLVTGFLIRTTLRRPLESLSKIARRYASGVYDTGGQPLPYREFRPFGEALTHMADKIQEQIQVAREAEVKYRSIFENASEGIFQATIEGRILIANPAMARILGYGSPDLLTAEVTDISQQLYINAEDRKKVLTLLAEKGWITDYETRFYRRDNQKIWVLLSNRLVRDETGNPLYTEGLLTDITDRKRAEESLRLANKSLERKVEERTAELQAAKEAAEAANRSKSTFLANMSHELRTPLSAILGYSDLLQRDPNLQHGQRDYLNIINRSGEHLLALINSVLELSKIEAGHITLKMSCFDLPALLSDLHAMFSNKAETRNLLFTKPTAESLPRHLIADENKLRQILINMLGNAVKFTEKGSIALRVALADRDLERMRLIVEVADTGPGIAPEELDMVFEAFEQAANGRRSSGGTGLGMAISRDYARLMGGDLTVTSTPGKGSIFRLEIPVEEGHSPKKTAPPKTLVTGLKTSKPAPRVLVVDDGEENRFLLVTLLKQAGFDVRSAENGLQAVELFREDHPDFIWMDIRMPVMDGMEATRLIRETEGGRETKIVAISASGLAEERTFFLSAGFDELLPKPYREQQIYEVMARLLKVEYLFQGEVVTPMQESLDLQVDPERLATLPSDLRSSLYQAVLLLDSAKIRAKIAEVSTRDSVLAEGLQNLAKNFDFDQMLELLEMEFADEHEEKLH